MAASAAFWKGLTLFLKRHSTLLSHTIRRVTWDRLRRAGQYRVGIGCRLTRQIKSFENSSNRVDGPSPAAAYVRMSTDHQKYSTENQLDTIRRYAEQRGYNIVRVFEDSGRSGLRMDGRDGLKSLMQEVQSGTADFQAILVYDASRWGRFQDADEAAYHG